MYSCSLLFCACQHANDNVVRILAIGSCLSVDAMENHFKNSLLRQER